MEFCEENLLTGNATEGKKEELIERPQGAKGEGKVEKNLEERKSEQKKDITKYMSLKKNPSTTPPPLSTF